jgi:hypothetical protein
MWKQRLKPGFTSPCQRVEARRAFPRYVSSAFQRVQPHCGGACLLRCVARLLHLGELHAQPVDVPRRLLLQRRVLRLGSLDARREFDLGVGGGGGGPGGFQAGQLRQVLSLGFRSSVRGVALCVRTGTSGQSVFRQ